LPFDAPTNSPESGKDTPRLARRPAAHGDTAKTLPICGTGSP
jgi:hypothetical protein